jgi:hypothetical protein
MRLEILSRSLVLLLITLLAALRVYGQDEGTLHVVLVDRDSASIPRAVIRIKNDGGASIKEVDANQPENFIISGLRRGKYVLEIEADGFEPFVGDVEIGPGLNSQTVKLAVGEIREEVKIDQEALERTLDEVFSRAWTIDEIEALPATPEEIEAELKRRYGEDIVIKVDGFSGGRLPPKEQIASIKVVRSSFDAEFHEIGYALVDVKTKAGLPKVTGFARFSFGDESLNARHAFAPATLPEQSRTLIGFLGIPLIRKKTSATISLFAINHYSQKNIIAALPGGGVEAGAESRREIFSPTVGLDHNLSEHRTIHLHYQFQKERLTNLGVGNLNLAETGFSRDSTAHQVRLSGLALIGGRFVNEFRAELRKSEAQNRPNARTPSLSTLNTFVSGGAGIDNSNRSRRLYGVNNLMFAKGIHSLKFGGEVEFERAAFFSANGTNGAFLFTSLADYLNNRPAVYTQRLGTSEITVRQAQVAAYAQDDIRLHRNLSIGLGLRYEWQNNLKDRANFSPRLSFTFSPSDEGKIVFRGGVGVFYRWLDTQNLTTILSNDGRQTNDLIIISPGYPDPAAGGTSSRPLAPSVMTRAEDLSSPYVFVVQTGFNYRVVKKLNVEAFYKFQRGVHQFRSRDTNAPLNGARPSPLYGRVAQVESSGSLKEHSLDIRVEGSLFKEFSFGSRYRLAKASNDFDGMFDLPVDNYNTYAEKGASSLDRRHSLSGSLNLLLLKKLRVASIFRLDSPLPYTITSGRDDNGDTVFNDRPAGISRNGERGAWLRQVDLRLDWRVPLFRGERAEPGSMDASPKGFLKNYAVGMDLTILNIFNQTNPQNFVGNQLSPFYRQATSAAPARQIQVGLSVLF